MTTYTDSRYIHAIGGGGIVREIDIDHLKKGVKLVFDIMRDGLWHTIAELQEKTGQAQADRRMRELRSYGFEIEKERIRGTRTWRYRLLLQTTNMLF